MVQGGRHGETTSQQDSVLALSGPWVGREVKHAIKSFLNQGHVTKGHMERGGAAACITCWHRSEQQEYYIASLPAGE